MQIQMISFTENGYLLGNKIKEILLQQFEKSAELQETRIALTNKMSIGSLQDWTKEAFTCADVIVFIGACGIAVRSIAPFLKSKYVDPAVIVIDEAGKFCISLLSGHIGGANEWTEKMAALIGAVPVITTATDLRHCFAVDVFVKKKGLYAYPKERCKEISAALVAGNDVYLRSDFQIAGELPAHLITADTGAIGMHITLFPKKEDFYTNTLYIIPRIISLGIGCKKNTTRGQIEEAVTIGIQEFIGENSKEMVPKEKLDVWMRAIARIASIDKKKDEKGLLDFAKQFQIPFLTFSKETLLQIEGDFTSSSFVEQTVGVDNVCERAAVAASEQGRIIMKKRACNGVTIALALADWSVDFA